eukprot:2358983-Pleurochrysis_carterae.AAC.3
MPSNASPRLRSEVTSTAEPSVHVETDSHAQVQTASWPVWVPVTSSVSLLTSAPLVLFCSTRLSAETAPAVGENGGTAPPRRRAAMPRYDSTARAS